MNEKMTAALSRFVDTARAETAATLDQLNPAFYDAALALINESVAAGGRVHVTGIGKPSYVSGYTASLMSSTGTPTYFLDGTEAVHGSSGQVREGDVVILVSNSGETAELLATANTLKRNGARLIAVTGNAGSALATLSEAHLLAHADGEGGPLNRAPRCSILSETMVLQGLSVLLQAQRDMTPAEYVRFHPGGSLGKLREGEA